MLPVATAATRKRITEILAQPEFATLPITLTDKQSDTVCTAADVVLVTSGTATLEVALCKRPMVISYKISPLTYAYVKNKIKVPHVGLPNILLGKAAVPELLQHDAVPENWRRPWQTGMTALKPWPHWNKISTPCICC